MSRYLLRSVVIAFAAWSLLFHLAFADSVWPTKPITLVVPFPYGGGSDAIGRLLAERLGKEIGQPIIVSNRPGANGSIASDAVMHAKPDGYTLILTSIGTHAINPLVNPHVRYDPCNDFTHISMVARAANVLLASQSFSGSTIQDVAAQSKDKLLNFAITGYGSSNHVALALFEQAAQLQFNHIPYKGDAAAINDMLGDQVHLMFVNYLAALPYIKTNRLRAIAVTGTTRNELLPYVPTLKEAGFDVVVEAWIGLAAPAKLPAAIVKRLNALTNKILQSQEMQERLAASGTTIMTGTSQEASMFIAKEIEKWSKVVKSAKIVAE